MKQFIFSMKNEVHVMYQYIENCQKYYNYGNIESSVCAHSFVYDYDEIDLYSFIGFLEDVYPKYHIYMFLSKKCNFPIDFLDKHFGLWKNLTKKKTLDVTYFEENVNNFKNYAEYYGFAKTSDLAACPELFHKRSHNQVVEEQHQYHHPMG